MKKLLVAVLMSTTLFACKKDSPAPTPVDERDKFVGDYSGTFTFSIVAGQPAQTSNNTHTITKVSTSSNQILVDGKTATVNGNSFVYVPFTESIDDPTYGVITATFNGTGTLNGSNLIETGTIVTIVQGNQLNGTWSSNTVKQ